MVALYRMFPYARYPQETLSVIAPSQINTVLILFVVVSLLQSRSFCLVRLIKRLFNILSNVQGIIML